MGLLLKNGTVFGENGFEKRDVFVNDGMLVSPPTSSDEASLFNSERTSIINSEASIYNSEASVYNSEEAGISAVNYIDCSNKFILPGFVDVHVHLREPGFSYKETILTGTRAGAAGGFTTIFSMPNLNPAPSTLETLRKQLDIIERDALINVIPYGTITMSQSGGGQLSNMEELGTYVCAFSDDGRGVQAGSLMEEAMIRAKNLNKLIVAHCEDESLLTDKGYIHKGEYARLHGHRGISSESEWKQVERDVELAAKTGCPYHVCHISTKETVEIIRQAKKSGIDVTCETAPHYLILTDMDLEEEGRFKMNPPIRSHKDREALLCGIADGTIDMIATDHAPHSALEKSKGLEKSAFGIVGLETSFPLMYTYLVKKNIIDLHQLIKLMSSNPRKRFSLPKNNLEFGDVADLVIVDLDNSYTINSADFMSMGKATPFDGYKVSGAILGTVCNGNLVYRRG